jgi:hypothetical protein
MGIYYSAVDWQNKKQFQSPEGFSIKSPGIFHPNNPFPAMVMMKNYQGYNFELVNDMSHEYEISCSFEDITQDVYKEYLSYWNEKEE